MNNDHDWKHEFKGWDFRDAKALVAKLLDPPDDVVRQVRELIPPALLQDLAAAKAGPVDRIIKLLVAEFNRILAGPHFLDAETMVRLTLRPVTRKWLARPPGGNNLRMLRKLVLQDVFPVELDREGSEPLETKVCSGVQFLVYRVRRAGKKGYKDHYNGIYTGPSGRQTVWANSWKSFETKTASLAKELLQGNAPVSKEQWEAHLRNSRAYRAIIKSVAEAKITGEEAVLKFIANAVQAQMVIGLERSLLAFVHRADEVMPKPQQHQWIDKAFLKYKAHCKTGRQVEPETLQKRLNTILRFAEEIPLCELIAGVLIEHQSAAPATSSSLQLNSATFQEEIAAAAKEVGKGPRQFWCHEISSLGIQVWLRRQPYGATTRRKALTTLRHFFRFLRDHEHAIPEAAKTVADLVPMPEAKRRDEPASILWFDEVWDIFLNLQDLESVFFFALCIYAGLHQTEVHRIQWEDVQWDKHNEPVELLVRSRKGPPGPDAIKPRYIRILYPLNKVLKLGQGRKGPIITSGVAPRAYVRVQKVAKRLGIQWSPSIMRHSVASFLYSAGLSLGEVGDYLGDLDDTVSRWYLRKLPKWPAGLHWSLPFSTSIFSDLPETREDWDYVTAFKRIGLSGADVAKFVREQPTNVTLDSAIKWEIVSPTPYSPVILSRAGAKGRYVRSGIRWPSDLEFQVMLFVRTPNEIAASLGCNRSSVDSHAGRGDFEIPNPTYWHKNLRRRKAGLELPLPPRIRQLKELLEKQKAELVKTGKVVLPSPVGEKNTDPEAVIVPFGVQVKGKGLLPAPRRQTPLVRPA